MDSHWAYHHPAYRRRHGSSSARSRTSTRPKILYIREDDLLNRIRHHKQLPWQQTVDLRIANPRTVAGYLVSNKMIIVGDHDTWTIETETTTDLTPAPRPAFAPARVTLQQHRKR